MVEEMFIGRMRRSECREDASRLLSGFEDRAINKSKTIDRAH